MTNPAFEKGRLKVPWWQDWRDQVCVVVASGPSVVKEDVAAFMGQAKYIAIKQNYDICPWADVVYGCDSHWWASRRGLPGFSGLKLSYDAVEYFPVDRIDIRRDQEGFLFDEPGVVGNGGNSGHQAINIAGQFGASRIILMGFDFHDRSGPHWYGRNNWPGANNPDMGNCRRWQHAIEQGSKDLARVGIHVVNCSRLTAIKCFPVRTVEQIREMWCIHGCETVTV